MNIVVISTNYPSKQRPLPGIFVHQIVQEFVKLGNRVTVVSPTKNSLSWKNGADYGQELATVLRPKTFSFSNKKIGFIDTFSWTRHFSSLAIRKAVSRIEYSPEFIYCHFIVSALHYFQAFPYSNIPVYIAVGEFHWIDDLRKHYDAQYYSDILGKIKGFIAVSPQVEGKLLTLGVPHSKIHVVPNATDLNLFKPRDKNALRIKYGLPLDKKIILFVGGLKEAKGPLRVLNALSSLPDGVAAVFIGNGLQKLKHQKILFSGAVIHDLVADYMSLADLFVLPTLHEGSNNAIIEAMASGLPIVSSDIPEIRAQCRPDYSILVDPMSVEEIASALRIILSDESLRKQMSGKALEEAKKYDITKRAQRILKFIMSTA